MLFRFLSSLIAVALGAVMFTGCSVKTDLATISPTYAEPDYFGSPKPVVDPIVITVQAKFLYRQLNFNPSITGYENGLGNVVADSQAISIPFAEFHIYDSGGTRVQQGETNTNGKAIFELPKTAGDYTIKIFSRAMNDYLKISVLGDINSNQPYSVAKAFSVTDADIAAGTKDLSSSPVIAPADETISADVEGGAFNIMYDILLANEYIRRNIGKNNGGTGTPSADSSAWWVADKVTIYWKAGFNPYSYYNGTAALSFYSPEDSRLFILGGYNGDVASSDTDHFDDSVILHEYAHFLEDTYGRTGSPGGSHNGNFVIDPRLAWSEGWANYFQAAVLTGADAKAFSASENRIPTTKRYRYYVDTFGHSGGSLAGLNIAFDLTADGMSPSELDNVYLDSQGHGTFREVSVSRTLYKSTRSISSVYTGTKTGGGIPFSAVWKAFAGEDATVYNRDNPFHYSFRNSTIFPIPNAGLFNWFLYKALGTSAAWDSILTEEKQSRSTVNYAYLLNSSTCSGVSFVGAKPESKMTSKDPGPRSDQLRNNDFYLFYQDGSTSTISMTYTTSGNAPDLDLVLYSPSYVYFEDYYWNAGQTSPYILRSSRTSGTSELISVSSLPVGYYLLNVKVNTHGSTLSSDMNGTSTYKLYKDGGAQLCGTERP